MPITKGFTVQFILGSSHTNSMTWRINIGKKVILCAYTCEAALPRDDLAAAEVKVLPRAAGLRVNHNGDVLTANE